MSEKSKSIVITGCSSGIGEESAKLFAERGWVVFAGVRKPVDAEKLRELHPNIRPVILDVTNEEGVKKVFEEIRVAVGEDGLDGVVNNAGYGGIEPLEFANLSIAHRQFDVNVFGPIRVIQAALPLLRMGKPGRIINIGSLSSDQKVPIIGLYCASKAALVTLNECLRQELARFGIKVVIMKPGPVESKFRTTFEKIRQDLLTRYPEGSLCDQYYGKILAKAPKILEDFDKHCISGRAAGERIYGIMHQKNPRSIQCDTWGSYFQTLMISLLPTWMYDYVLNSTMLA